MWTNWISIQGAFRDGKHMPSIIYLCIYSLATYMYISEYKLVSSILLYIKIIKVHMKSCLCLFCGIYSVKYHRWNFKFSLNQVLINYSKSKVLALPFVLLDAPWWYVSLLTVIRLPERHFGKPSICTHLLWIVSFTWHVWRIQIEVLWVKMLVSLSFDLNGLEKERTLLKCVSAADALCLIWFV